MNDFKGKRVLVTGGSQGIGRAIVLEFERRSATVVNFDIFPDPESDDVTRDPSLYHNVYITNKAAVRAACDKLWSFDILVNNAGITGGDDWDKIMAVNLTGTHNVTEAVIPKMRQRGGGSIIFITSVHSRVAFAGDCAYDVSKCGLVGYMRARAVELARYGIRVNAVAPGGTKHAGGTAHMSESEIREAGERLPIGRFCEPEEIAKVVVFLASSDASYIVGQEIVVDGGLVIKNCLQ